MSIGKVWARPGSAQSGWGQLVGRLNSHHATARPRVFFFLFFLLFFFLLSSSSSLEKKRTLAFLSPLLRHLGLLFILLESVFTHLRAQPDARSRKKKKRKEKKRDMRGGLELNQVVP